MNDSIWVEKVKGKLNFLSGVTNPDSSLLSLFKSADSILHEKNSSSGKRSKLIKFQGGYLQYYLTYRSFIDTPYSESDILQHLSSFTGDFVISDIIPVRINFFDRESNSVFFRDYRDIKIDIDGPQLRRLQQEQLQRTILGKLHRIGDSSLLRNLNFSQWELAALRNSLQHPSLITLLIESKDNIVYKNERNSKSPWTDSVLQYSQLFKDRFSNKERYLDSLSVAVDSMTEKYAVLMKKLQQLQQLLKVQTTDASSIRNLIEKAKDAGLPDKELPRVPGLLYNLRRLSIGRTLPDRSGLTVKNINVRGIDAEFGNEHWYAAIIAGTIDYRLRDFISSDKKGPLQYVYALTAGIGKKNGTHFFLTGYKGRKQLYTYNKPSVEIAGISGEFRYSWKEKHSVSVEGAHSTVPVSMYAGGSTKPFDLKDRSADAYQFQWRSFFPIIKASVEATYQHTGINFHSFNSYRTNAATESWSIKYEQYLIGRMLRINASARKNDFNNPLIEQRYKTNAVFKTLQASFQKKYWPAVSVGYLPSSQYIVMEDRVFESRYQTFTALATHSYNIGIAKAVTSVFYSRFYNSGNDSGFIYNNARNFSLYQYLNFSRHTASISTTLTKGYGFSLIVGQAGAATHFGKWLQAELGVKISNMDRVLTKSGLYARGGILIPWIGQIMFSYDDSYIPGVQKQLIRNQQLTIGLTRRIK